MMNSALSGDLTFIACLGGAVCRQGQVHGHALVSWRSQPGCFVITGAGAETSSLTSLAQNAIVTD